MSRRVTGFKQTSSDDFFAYINPRDIVICNRGSWKDGNHFQSFQTRSGIEVGRVYTKPSSVGQDEYFLAEKLI